MTFNFSKLTLFSLLKKFPIHIGDFYLSFSKQFLLQKAKD